MASNPQHPINGPVINPNVPTELELTVIRNKIGQSIILSLANIFPKEIVFLGAFVDGVAMAYAHAYGASMMNLQPEARAIAKEHALNNLKTMCEETLTSMQAQAAAQGQPQPGQQTSPIVTVRG